MRYLIKVTKECIKTGIRHDGLYCPIARAIKNKFIFEKVAVGIHRINIGNIISIPLSKSATRFILKFDDKRKVKPFNFYININEKLGKENSNKNSSRK